MFFLCKIGVTHYLICDMPIVTLVILFELVFGMFKTLFIMDNFFLVAFHFSRLPALVKRHKIDRPFYVLAIKSGTVIIDRPIHSANRFTRAIDTSDIHAATNM